MIARLFAAHAVRYGRAGELVTVSAHVSRPKRPCPHAIEIDFPRRRYAPGDRIEGTVRARVGPSDRCEELSVELQLHSHGKVKSVAAVAESRVFSGEWREGEVASYAFELEVPVQARGYRGGLFTVELRLAAVLLSTRWPPTRDAAAIKAFSGVSTRKLEARAYPAATVPIEVVHAPRAIALSIDRERVAKALGERGTTVYAAVAVALFGAGTMLVGGILGITRCTALWIALIPVAMGALIGVAGLVPFVRNIRSYLAERAIGVPEIAIEPGPRLSVRFAPASVRGVRAIVRLVEVALDFSGDSIDRTERVLADLPHALARDPDGAFRADLVVPPDLSPAIDAGAAGLEWRVLVFIDRGFGSWRAQVPLETGSRSPPRAVVTFE
jgi:hypothetical protein